MRIISALSVLLVAIVIFGSQKAIAQEIPESNETKINFKINDEFNIKNEIFLVKNELLIAYENNLDQIISGENSKKIEEKSEREKALERFSEKRRLAKLPEGKFTINASAYTAAADECGKSDGITASGLMVQENETIACPPQFPFGVKIKIEGMGTYICQDRGGAIKGNKMDIYMETKKEAFAFGRQNLQAEIVL